jgi:hypothetical protein
MQESDPDDWPVRISGLVDERSHVKWALGRAGNGAKRQEAQRGGVRPGAFDALDAL